MRYVLLVVLFVLSVPAAYAQQVRISGLQNISLPRWGNGDPSIYRYIDVCIYRSNLNGKNRRYGISVQGDGPGFFLRSGQQRLRYNLLWFAGGAGNPGGGRAIQLNSNTPVFVDVGNARINTDQPENSSDCNGNSAPTARLALTISTTDLDIVPDGTYSGMVFMTISAQ